MRILLSLFFICVIGLSAYGEAPHSNLDAPSDTLAFPTPVAPATTLDTGLNQVSKRLFGVIPNYRADQYQSEYKPINVREKFAIAKSDSFDWPNYFLLAGLAAQSQMAAGGLKHAGGFAGFGEYYGRSVADQIVGAYVTEAILPSLLHEDPRFFRLGKGPALHRAFYAASRIFITKKDNGGTGFYFSEIVGNLGVAAVGDLYYPNSQSLSTLGSRYGLSLGNDMISNVLTEFWPDIRRRLRVPFLRKPF